MRGGHSGARAFASEPGIHIPQHSWFGREFDNDRDYGFQAQRFALPRNDGVWFKDVHNQRPEMAPGRENASTLRGRFDAALTVAATSFAHGRQHLSLPDAEARRPGHKIQDASRRSGRTAMARVAVVFRI